MRKFDLLKKGLYVKLPHREHLGRIKEYYMMVYHVVDDPELVGGGYCIFSELSNKEVSSLSCTFAQIKDFQILPLQDGDEFKARINHRVHVHKVEEIIINKEGRLIIKTFWGTQRVPFDYLENINKIELL